MFVSDVSDFKFVSKVKPVFFIAKEEVKNTLLRLVSDFAAFLCYFQ